MGKTPKDRKHAVSARVASDPTVNQQAVQAALFSSTASSSSSIQHEHDIAQNQQLLEKLSGSDVQKAMACSGLAHIIANQLRPATSVITGPLLKRLIPILLERQSYDVAISAAGALRNISAICNSTETAKGNPLKHLLLNSDTCTVTINLLEADKTQWILNLPPTPPTSSPFPTATTGIIPITPIDKRYHFLTQVVSSLANLTEQFDVVLGYFTANKLALQHLLLLLLDTNTIGAAAVNTYHGIALQVEISNFLLLVSESNAEFSRALQALPTGFGGVQGITLKLIQKLDPTSADYAQSPQVRAHCAGILLNLQSSQVLMSLSSAVSSGLGLPGSSNAPISGEQLSVTSILSTISSILDFDPLKLGEELCVQLRHDRAQVDHQLSLVEKQRSVADDIYKEQAAARHALKMAKKARLAAGGEASMEDDVAPVDEQKGDVADGVIEEKTVEVDQDIIFADEQDAFEATHKDASAAQNSAAANSNKKSPEVLIASQWSNHLEENLNKFRQYLLSIKISLELLTNLCSSSEEEEDISDSDSDSGAGAVLDPNHLGYIPKLILHLGIMNKIVTKCHLHLNPELMKPVVPATTAGDDLMEEKDGSTTAISTSVQPQQPTSLYAALTSIFTQDEVSQRIIELIDEIRNRCINCLNNIILYLPKEVLASSELSNLFSYGCQLISELAVSFQNNVPVAIDEISNLTSLLFQLARKDLKQIPCNKDVVMMLVQLGRTANVTPTAPPSTSSPTSLSLTPTPTPTATVLALPSKHKVQLNVIGLLGLLGTKPESFPYNFVIGSVLLEIVKFGGETIHAAKQVNNIAVLHIESSSDETHFIECVSESLNALIDIYSEDDIHVKEQKSLAMINILDQFLPLFQDALKVIKSQHSPKVPKQLIERMEANRLNAKEFVKYKKQTLK